MPKRNIRELLEEPEVGGRHGRTVAPVVVNSVKRKVTSFVKAFCGSWSGPAPSAPAVARALGMLQTMATSHSRSGNSKRAPNQAEPSRSTKTKKSSDKQLAEDLRRAKGTGKMDKKRPDNLSKKGKNKKKDSKLRKNRHERNPPMSIDNPRNADVGRKRKQSTSSGKDVNDAQSNKRKRVAFMLSDETDDDGESDTAVTNSTDPAPIQPMCSGSAGLPVPSNQVGDERTTLTKRVHSHSKTTADKTQPSPYEASLEQGPANSDIVAGPGHGLSNQEMAVTSKPALLKDSISGNQTSATREMQESPRPGPSKVVISRATKESTSKSSMARDSGASKKPGPRSQVVGRNSNNMNIVSITTNPGPSGNSTATTSEFIIEDESIITNQNQEETSRGEVASASKAPTCAPSTTDGPLTGESELNDQVSAATAPVPFPINVVARPASNVDKRATPLYMLKSELYGVTNPDELQDEAVPILIDSYIVKREPNPGPSTSMSRANAPPTTVRIANSDEASSPQPSSSAGLSNCSAPDSPTAMGLSDPVPGPSNSSLLELEPEASTLKIVSVTSVRVEPEEPEPPLLPAVSGSLQQNCVAKNGAQVPLEWKCDKCEYSTFSKAEKSKHRKSHKAENAQVKEFNRSFNRWLDETLQF